MSACVFCPTGFAQRRPGMLTGRPLFAHIESATSLWTAQSVGGMYVSFEPLNPVTPGHLLVAPVEHAEHAATNPALTAGCMEVAATIASRYKSANILTSIGAPATQTVPHLHLHVVPRRPGDGLKLPWSTP